MSIEFKPITSIEDVAAFVAGAISSHLQKGDKVVWFATGGSSIKVCIEVSRKLVGVPLHNLTVLLTDERYGELSHPDSNWNQLIQGGFSLPDATLLPTLTGDNRDTTTEKFNTVLKNILVGGVYKIGSFGIGPDGHTAGVLPHTEAVESIDLAYGYTTEKFERITMTPKAIAMLDEAVVYAVGENKWPTLQILREDHALIDQPAQILKKIPKVTLFTDYH